MGVSAHALLCVHAVCLYAQADTDGNGVLSFDEFQQFYASSGGLLSGPDSSVPEEPALATEPAPAAPSSSSLDKIARARAVTGLGNLTAKDVFAQLKRECPSGSLRRSEFTRYSLDAFGASCAA